MQPPRSETAPLLWLGGGAVNWLGALVGLVGLCLTTSVPAQSYPTRPVTIVVTAAAGGLTDLVARAVGQQLSEMWGKPVVRGYPDTATSDRPGAPSGRIAKDREPMENFAHLKHEIHQAEATLLTKLRSLRRDLRRTQGQEGRGDAHLAATELTTGQRIADIVAASMGSWNFIIIQSIILVIWIILNVTAYVEQWDPYPFILLNLALSFQAAYAAPFIMMSQNRQQDIDRKAAENDHQINIKAELEIELLHQKIDQLRETEVLNLTQAVKELTGILRKAKIEPGPAAIN
jgi:uncharacterized membrane protein